MKADAILRKFEATHQTWRTKLESLDDATVERPPAGGGWSIGQVCHHIGSVSDMLRGNAELCAAGDGEEKGFQFQPALICVVGSLPPMKITVPDLPPALRHLSEPKAMTKAAALVRLEGVLEHMRSLVDAVANASPRRRRRHPVGGWLNARQWYHMNEMHVRHHLRQLRRLLKDTGN